MSSRNLKETGSGLFSCELVFTWNSRSKRDKKRYSQSEKKKKASPVCSIQPSHTESLKHHHNDKGQSGGVVIEHGHKVVPTTLREQKANEKANDAAENCNMKKNRIGELKGTQVLFSESISYEDMKRGKHLWFILER